MEEPNSLNSIFTGRNILAGGIAIFSIIILGIIAWKGMAVFETGTSFEQKNQAIQNIYNTFLPLIGTWMGAVIAFYFGKENFEAANKNVQAMVEKMTTSDDKLKAIKVSDANVMISVNNITDNKIIRTKSDDQIMLEADLLGFFEANKNIERLPIMDDKLVVRYILHKSLITDFALAHSRKKITALAAKDLSQVSLNDMINNSNDDYKLSVTKSVEFISKEATLLEVQTKIKNSKYCQDVFVTDDGSATKPIIGWITNNKVQELGRV